MRRTLTFILLVCLFRTGAAAQEFRCEASVIAPQVSNLLPNVLRSMEIAIKEFYQTRRFTNQNYSPEERIDINLLLTINNAPAADRFEGTLQVIYSRPVYGTDYTSPIIDLVDVNVGFNFLENTVIEFTPDHRAVPRT